MRVVGPITRLSVAPMAQSTNRHQLKFMRLISKHTSLFTEMLYCDVLLQNPEDTPHRFFPAEADDKIILQLATGCETALFKTAQLALRMHPFKGINLNCGCPASRADAGNFGASLLRTPQHLLGLAQALREAAPTPINVSVKMRTGVDGAASYDALVRLTSELFHVGIDHVILHARDAILDQRVSTNDNRRIPPLRRDW